MGGLISRVLKMSMETFPDWLISFWTSGIMTWMV